MFIETSRDLLNVVLAFSVLWVALFLSWMLYYATQILRHANEMVEEVQDRLHELSESVGYIRDKLELVGAGVGFLMDGIKMVMGKAMQSPTITKAGKKGIATAKKKAVGAWKHLTK